MIVVDVETSGLDPIKNGLWQIGAVDLSNPSNIFLEESRLDDEDEFTEGAAKVHGKNEEYLRDEKKQSQKDLLEKFFTWCSSIKMKNTVCQNPQFDLGFITIKARKYGLNLPFAHRSFDMHSIAAVKYFDINKEFLIEEGEGYSGMKLPNVLKFCGMEDKRGNHNALEDAKLTAECLSRILHGKSLFSEYAQYKIPGYLAKGAKQ